MTTKEDGKITLLHQLLLVTIGSWVNQEQQKTITYLKKQNEVLLAHLEKELGGRRLLLTDKERRKLGQLRSRSFSILCGQCR